MVAVAVMLLVFFTIGVSILTAAAGTTAASSARIRQRQAYAYAKSILMQLDGSLRKGGLKDLLCADALDEIQAAYQTHQTEVELNGGNEKEIGLNVAFTGDQAPGGKIDENLTVQSAYVRYKGRASVLNTSTDPISQVQKITEVSLRLNSVALSVQTAYQTDCTSSITVNYRFSGYGKLNPATNQWEWSGTWVVQQVS